MKPVKKRLTPQQKIQFYAKIYGYKDSDVLKKELEGIIKQWGLDKRIKSEKGKHDLYEAILNAYGLGLCDGRSIENDKNNKTN